MDQSDHNSEYIEEMDEIEDSEEVTKSNGFADFLKKNKFIILIAIVILGILIWWFCIRKKSSGGSEVSMPDVSVDVPKIANTNPSGIRVTKTRVPSYQ